MLSPSSSTIADLQAVYDIFYTKTNNLPSMVTNEESFADSKLVSDSKGHLTWHSAKSTNDAPVELTAYLVGQIGTTEDGNCLGCRGNKTGQGLDGRPIVVYFIL